MPCVAVGAFAVQTRSGSLTAGPTCASFALKRRQTDEAAAKLESPSAVSREAAQAGE